MKGACPPAAPSAEKAVEQILFGAKLTDTGSAAVERLLGAALEDVTCGLGFKVDPTELKNTKVIENAFKRLTAAEDRRRSRDGLGVEPLVFKERKDDLGANFTDKKEGRHAHQPGGGLHSTPSQLAAESEQRERAKQRKEGLREVNSLKKEKIGFVDALIASKPKRRR